MAIHASVISLGPSHLLNCTACTDCVMSAHKGLVIFG
jgi:hypothetical protein